MRPMLALTLLIGPIALAACGGSSTQSRSTGTPSRAQVAVDPAALYCQGSGGTVLPRISGGRRADLCRMPDGRTVRAADLLNSHNDL
ncbi:DUF333 domain-containing protein [Paracoccus xiamenensis]|uniref:DUF333 domain-containing protein n=1 Tax=Paracoccus xiamenensis TaxID=2714901 RepID=UPI00140DA841|nr:DUF333 domain-containing protein [Paracoccus xiamenensis]NHF73741.1 DUF333 domain-containing protein [Paracoccus xiamenensis]